MKKVVAVLSLLVSFFISQAQVGGTFPSVDSLRKYNNRYFRNSAIDVFSNLRGNTINNGVINFLDSARLSWGGSRDTLQTRLGVRVDSTGPNKIRVEYKGASFNNTADLRAFTGTINTTYVYRVKNDSTISDFYYDSLDNTSADNGVTVIVNGSKRLKVKETILYGEKFGMKGDFDPGTGTGFDNTAAMRKMFSLFTGSKDARNVTIQIGAGEYGFLDTLATPNSAGFFTIRGEGRSTTTLWYKGTAGKDFLTLRNSQKPTIEDLELAAYTHASAMIRLHTDAGIIGTSGMVSHAIIRNVEMRGNRGAFDYGIRKTCSPDHDQNNEQTLMENCFIDLADIAAYSNEMFNALWDRAENCYFSADRTTIRMAKPNPGGSVDSAGGSLDMVNCTVMSFLASDTLIYIVGGQVSILNGRSEGPGRTMIYARKSAEGSRPIIRVTGGTFTIGIAQGTAVTPNEFNINTEGTFLTFDGTSLLPENLLKMRITDSLTYAIFRGGNVSIDSLWYSSNIIHEKPAYEGNGTIKKIQLYSDKGSYKIINAVSNYREITSTSATLDVSGENVFGLAPASATTYTNFLSRGVYDEITIVALNGNVTIANNANIITNTGANISLQANQVVKLVRNGLAYGGSWVVQTGIINPPTVSNNTIPLWSTSSNKFTNSLFTQTGGELFAGGTLNTSQVINSGSGIIISDIGNTDKQLQLQSTDATLFASITLRNAGGDKLYFSSYGASHAKARQARIAFDGPNAIHYDALDAAGEHSFDVASTTEASIKTGSLRLKASNYLNWGATTGTSGYGIRDNAGTIEIKNSGGSWGAPTSGSTIYSGSGSLAGNRVVDGSASNFTLQFGDRDASKHVATFRVDADDVELRGGVYKSYTLATDGNYTVAAIDYYIELPTAATVNRTITLGSPSKTGRELIIKNKNSSAQKWSFAVAVKDGADASVTDLVNDTTYHLFWDGTNWNIVN